MISSYLGVGAVNHEHVTPQIVDALLNVLRMTTFTPNHYIFRGAMDIFAKKGTPAMVMVMCTNEFGSLLKNFLSSLFCSFKECTCSCASSYVLCSACVLELFRKYELTRGLYQQLQDYLGTLFNFRNHIIQVRSPRELLQMLH